MSKPTEKWFGYWTIGLPHLMMNALGDVAVYVLWKLGMLDKAFGLVGTGDWANVGVPFTPEVGILVGAAADMFADQLAFVLRKVVGSRLPFTKQEEVKDGQAEVPSKP